MKANIIRSRTTIEFPGTDLVATHPFYGPANSKTLSEQIRKDNLREPTSPQVVTFAHSLYGKNRPIEQEVTGMMRNNYFRGFTGVLFRPKEGVADFIDYPKFDEQSVVDKNDLLARIGESRAQVPFEHLMEGPVGWREIAKHPYFIASGGGKQGAENLAELASRHSSQQAYIFVPNVSQMQKPEARVVSLNSGYDGWLVVGADGDGNGDGTYAFGVRVPSGTSVGEAGRNLKDYSETELIQEILRR